MVRNPGWILSYISLVHRNHPLWHLRCLWVSSHLSLRNREGVSVGRLPIVRLYEHARGAHVLEVDDVCRPIPELSTDGVKRGRLFTPPGHGHSRIKLTLNQLSNEQNYCAIWYIARRTVWGSVWCLREPCTGCDL